MRGMTDQNPSDALTRPRRPLHAFAITAAGLLVLGGLSYTGVALAQTLAPQPAPTTTADVADEPENVAPVAVIAATGGELTASVDGTGSTDDGEIVSYVWNFGDSSVAEGPTVTHTYGAAGDYTVTLLITDDGGLTGLGTTTVTVTAPPAPPPPPATSNDDPARCPAGSVVMENDGVNDLWCTWDYCLNLTLPDPDHPECYPYFRP